MIFHSDGHLYSYTIIFRDNIIVFLPGFINKSVLILLNGIGNHKLTENTFPTLRRDLLAYETQKIRSNDEDDYNSTDYSYHGHFLYMD